MSALFIANATKQDHDFVFRMGGLKKINFLPITKGGQIKIEGQLAELEAIVEQHRKYGITDFRECAKAHKFSGLIYSFDKSIKLDSIIGAIERHDEVIDESAQVIRQETAAAANENIEAKAKEAGAAVVATSFEIEEVNTDPTATGKKFKQMVEMDKQADVKVKRGPGRPRTRH